MENKKDIFLTLIEASSLLVSTLDTKEILPQAMNVIKDLLGCAAASIMLIDESEKKLSFEVALGEKSKAIEKITLPLGKGIAGEVAAAGEAKIVNDVTCCREFDRSFDERSGFTTKNILCVPLKFKDKIIGVAQAINSCRKNNFDKNDLYLLSLFGDQLSLTIESARLHKKILQQKHLEDELLFARTIQESFLPREFPETEEFSFWSATTPARQVGGDFYDIFPLAQDKIGFTIGDVSGKGVGAALLMAKILSQIKIISQKSENIDSPEAVLRDLNSAILERHSGNMFVTLIYGTFCRRSKKVTLASAAHPYPFYYSGAKKTWRSFDLNNGLPVGIMDGLSYTGQELTLTRGDTLVLFTDGILEAHDGAGNCFIPYVFSKIDAENTTTAEIGQTMLDELNRFVAPDHKFDDTTLLIIRHK